MRTGESPRRGLSFESSHGRFARGGDENGHAGSRDVERPAARHDHGCVVFVLFVFAMVNGERTVYKDPELTVEK